LGKHHNYMSQLGGRFFFLRVPELNTEMLRKGHKIAWDPTDRSERIKEARQLMSTYCHQAAIRAEKNFGEIKTESEEVQQWINTAADFISRGRGTTQTTNAKFTNDEGKEIDYYEVKDPQIEQPWRVLIQLRSLARVLAAIKGELDIGQDELQTLKPIVLSSMPLERALVVSVLTEENHLTAKELATRLDKSNKTARRHLKELEVLGIVESDKFKDPNTEYDCQHYSLKPNYKELLTDQNSITDAKLIKNETVENGDTDSLPF